MSHTELVKKILNEKNILITEDFINSVFKKVNFNHKVINLDNFQLAMIHSTYTLDELNDKKIFKKLNEVIPIDDKYISSCIPLQKNSYERLEFLGDAIIRHAISKYLYFRYPCQEEGFLTMNRSKIENMSSLSNIAISLGLQKYAIISRNMENINSRMTYPKLTADIFESFIGALNLEVSESKTVEFLWLIMENILDIPEIIRTQNNYKDLLMRHFGKFDNETTKNELKYIDKQEIDSNNKKKFMTIVSNITTGINLGIGYGRTKMIAQQKSAKDALIKLNVLKDEDEEEEYYSDNINIENEISKVRKNIMC